MARRIALEIKKEILDLLKIKGMTLRDLESKIDTNNKTIKSQIKELEFLGLVKVEKHEKSEKNGRPFSVVKLVKK